MHLFNVNRKMALNLSGLNTGQFYKLQVWKDGEYVDVATLGGGGGGSTLEPRVASLEAVVPQKADSTTLTSVQQELELDIANKASSQALTTAQLTLQAGIDSKANHIDLINLAGQVGLKASDDEVVKKGSGASTLLNDSVLMSLNTQLPLLMQTDTATNEVTILSGPASSLASPTTLGTDVTLSKTSGALQLTPARLRLGRLALECQGNGCYFQVSPDADGSTDPTVLHTKMGLDFNTGHIAIGTTHNPFDESRLFVLGDIRCNGLHTNQVRFGDGSMLTQTLDNHDARITSLESGGGGPPWNSLSAVSFVDLHCASLTQIFELVFSPDVNSNGDAISNVVVNGITTGNTLATDASTWWFQGGPHASNGIGTFSIPYLSGPTSEGERASIWLKVAFFRGSPDTIAATCSHRHNGVPGVITTTSGGILNSLESITHLRIRFLNDATFTGSWRIVS